MESINSSDVNQRDSLVRYKQTLDPTKQSTNNPSKISRNVSYSTVALSTLPKDGFDVHTLNVTLPNDGEYSIAGNLFA